MVNLDIRTVFRLVKTIVAVTNHAVRSESVTGLFHPTLVAGIGFDQMFGLLSPTAARSGSIDA